MASKRFRVPEFLFCLGWVASLISCGGGSRVVPPQVQVTVTPASAALDQGATQQFTGFAWGSSNGNAQVTWSVQEGAAGGSISSAGVYAAPATAGTFHVVATSVADPSKTFVATVNVNAVSVSVSGPTGPLDQGDQYAFSATVRGTVLNTTVTWSVQEGASGGLIFPDGVYRAPAAGGTFHVVATSVADPTKSAIAQVTVNHVTLTVTPSLMGIRRQGTRQLHATVTGTVDRQVTWGVEEGASGGAVDNDGLYTAPDVNGTFHVLATSVWDPNQWARAEVVVTDRGFAGVGQMTQARQGHTSTLLPNGEVLIAGGVTDNCDSVPPEFCFDGLVTASAELFDPSTNTFRPTGGMMTARFGHTATLLADGKVLIAGGSDGYLTCCRLSSAELYDPATESFITTGGMSLARAAHTATPLADGTVLVAGGATQGSPITTSAEIYDPALGGFTSVGSMAVGRNKHTATLLADGRVLVTGGMNGCDSFTSAELFNPATRAFSPTGNLTHARDAHSATLLADGRVLVAGGQSRSQCGLNLESRADAEIFDPVSSTFSALVNTVFGRGMEGATFRADHTATRMPSGDVLLVGAISDTAAAEFFDPVTASFVITGGMLRGREGHAATLLLDGRVLITGGIRFDKSAEVYQ
jgi:hypothetical protein